MEIKGKLWGGFDIMAENPRSFCDFICHLMSLNDDIRDALTKGDNKIHILCLLCRYKLESDMIRTCH